MSELKATPGPWSITKTNDAPASHEPYWQIVGRPDSHSASGPGITNVHPLPRAGGSVEAEANAKLIAAAPELYEALKWAMCYVDQVRVTDPLPEGSGEDIAYKYARNALAKSRGQ